MKPEITEDPLRHASSIVIIGAGQAGASAIETLRSEGYQDRLTLIGDEPLPPYQRPPLSKKNLLGEASADALLLHPRSFYAVHDVELRLGTPVSEIDTESRTLRLSDHSEVAWDRLLLATGARPRTLSDDLVNGFEAVFTMRSVADVDRMASRFVEANRVLIVGGGYIGLEAAAIARQRNLQVTLIETAPRILQRVAAAQTSNFFAALHRRNGVDLREDVSLDRVTTNEDGSCVVSLSDGSQDHFDFIIAGIGVNPATKLAQSAGLDIDNGIAVDQFCQTSDPRIFAAGDCASFVRHDRRIRLESVQNAIEQGRTAAKNMLGGTTPYDPVPWFWSDQYDVKLQIAGLSLGFDRTVSRSGSREGSSSVWYYEGARLLAVDAFNDAPAFMMAKRFLASDVSPAPDVVGNPEIDLKSLARRVIPSV